jgi:hypothetical protein
MDVLEDMDEWFVGGGRWKPQKTLHGGHMTILLVLEQRFSKHSVHQLKSLRSLNYYEAPSWQFGWAIT